MRCGGVLNLAERNLTGEIMFLYGWGPEEEGRFTTLLHLAMTATALDLKVYVFLFTEGVVLAKKDAVQALSDEMGRRFKELLKNKNVEVYVCEEAAKKRSITEDSLEEGISIRGYATFLHKAINARSVITV